MFDFFKNILGNTSNNLAEIIAKGALLVDVRTPAEFASGTAEGAINIPLDTLSQHLEAFQGKENIVVFCRSGNRSGMAKKILESIGFHNITNGGAWENVAANIQPKQ